MTDQALPPTRLSSPARRSFANEAGRLFRRLFGNPATAMGMVVIVILLLTAISNAASDAYVG